MPLNRNQVPEDRKWDLSSFYSSDEEAERAFDVVRSQIAGIKAYEGKLNDKNALDCLNANSKLSMELEKLCVYFALRKDENTKNPTAVALDSKADMLVVEVSSALAFINPELAAFKTSVLKDMSERPEYANFSVYLKDIIRDKKHILSAKEEKLLSEVGNFAGDFRNIFGTFDNADIKFGKVKSGEGKQEELSHGSYAVFLDDPSQDVRRHAFKAYYRPYKDMINTIAAIYAGSVKKDCASAKIRGFKSAMGQALYSENIKEKVYNNLLSAVERGTPAVHKYVAYRKKALGLDALHMYDMYVPIVKEGGLALDFEEAFELVVKALSPLGEKYIGLLREARKARWMDVEETENKRNGAYSWGCYSSNPVVLLNYAKTTHDVFTIAHELGHSIHSYMSHHAQCYEKGDYAIFVAEVASTVNEVLLLKYLLKDATGDMRKYLLSYYLDMFRTTLFRQTMFAEFEKFAHDQIEAGNPLTAEVMNNEYLALNKKYYGKAVIHDKEIAYEWCRIPHFYNAFYVYKYATGITSAVNIAHKILNEKGFVEKYYSFLSAGGSLDPLDTLKLADVDLTKPEPFNIAMKEFEETLKELEKTL